MVRSSRRRILAGTAAGPPRGQRRDSASAEHERSDIESETHMHNRTLELFVSGMGCRQCVREVTARLRDVSGVEIVSANAGRSIVRLTGTMSLANVLSAFEGTTYTLRLLDDPALDS
jgi:copper chaperone CopZ